jgi:hypothetical protein
VGQHEHAEPLVDEILQRDPQSYEGLMLKACIHEQRLEWERAADLYRGLLDRTTDRPMRVELQLAIARIRHELEDTAGALAALAEVDPPDDFLRFKLHCLRCAVLLGGGDREAAIGEYEAARKLYPKASNLGRMRADLGFPPENNSETAEVGPERHKPVQVTTGEGR